LEHGKNGTAIGRRGVAAPSPQNNRGVTPYRSYEWYGGGSNSSGPDASIMADEANDLEMRVDGDTLSVRGDIDLHQAAAFRQKADDHIRSVNQPRLNLSEVPFLDSAGLAALLALSRHAQQAGKTLRLVVTGSPRRVLKITGIDRMLLLED
jgi:anti-sigma B factor antagonist